MTMSARSQDTGEKAVAQLAERTPTCKASTLSSIGGLLHASILSEGRLWQSFVACCTRDMSGTGGVEGWRSGGPDLSYANASP